MDDACGRGERALRHAACRQVPQELRKNPSDEALLGASGPTHEADQHVQVRTGATAATPPGVPVTEPRSTGAASRVSAHR